jgi:hypothetical protein
MDVAARYDVIVSEMRERAAAEHLDDDERCGGVDLEDRLAAGQSFPIARLGKSGGLRRPRRPGSRLGILRRPRSRRRRAAGDQRDGDRD